jgi:hypothetical protein
LKNLSASAFEFLYAGNIILFSQLIHFLLQFCIFGQFTITQIHIVIKPRISVAGPTQNLTPDTDSHRFCHQVGRRMPEGIFPLYRPGPIALNGCRYRSTRSIPYLIVYTGAKLSANPSLIDFATSNARFPLHILLPPIG